MSRCKVSYNDVQRLEGAASDDAAQQIPYFDSPFYGRLEGLVSDFQKSMDDAYKATDRRNVGISPTTKKNTVAVNQLVGKTRSSNPSKFAQTFPALSSRFDRNPFLTPVEIDEFMEQFFYSGTLFYGQMTTNRNGDTIDTGDDGIDGINYGDVGENQNIVRDVLDFKNRVLFDLDAFYSLSKFKLGGLDKFCALAPNIFATIKEFANFFNNVQAIASKISDFFKGGATAALETIKKQAEELVERVMKDAMNVINNFTFETLGGIAHSYLMHKSPIYGRVMEKVEMARAFFSEENIKAIKERVIGLVSYATQVFKDPSLEEIEFLTYRFCSLLADLENNIMAVSNPVRESVQQYEAAHSALKSRSGMNTARAIAAGAIRYDETQRAEMAQTAVAEAREQGGPRAHEEPVTAADVEGVPRWEDIRASVNRDSRIVLSSSLSGTYSVASYGSHNMGRQGWEQVIPDVRVKLMRLQALFGKKLTINSGFRSRAYNELLRANTSGVARNSNHMQGEALDITWSGFSNRAEQERFVQCAYDVGFSGIGRYGTFIHVDVSGHRTW